MKIIACLNLKGGAGKTTTAVNLAGVLTGKGERAIVVDLDPQQSASRWAAQAKNANGTGFALARDVHKIESKSARVVKDRLQQLSADSGATIVVLDCPPELEERSLLAAMLATLVLIPTTASPLDIWAAEAAVATARDAQSVRESEFPFISLVPSRVVSSTVLGRELPETLATLGEDVAPAISQRVAVVEAAVVGQTVAEYAPGSPSHQEFQALANHVITILRNSLKS